ncbi:iron complex transport system substrate-binding protein [Pseudobutyrivibrio sp. UC1225]|uniref:ABC transporter substrate-binding protein n=1 Tax=Pseudobutyrivibrio sp. UC1225 TaxID=1798185 RepID=UPI0008E2D062|nr:ABC transporter substrate-binding protein [Pseudobutyrivibrio sp. UC1225]SFN51166.1 iron complex transport system substrate-binding protein [Pseudobutyrivibrio sp. UC1225]
MKKFGLIAAVLALSLTACSFFNKDNLIKDNNPQTGTYQCEIALEGGSGRATVESPAEVTVSEEGNTVKLVWSSSHYDYMVVDGIRYDNEANIDENSVFTIPFSSFDESFDVIGDTTAMSTPHEIEYTLMVFSPGTILSSEASIGEKVNEKQTDEVFLPSKLKYTSSMPLQYANQFSVDNYQDDNNKNYSFITIGSGDMTQYFLFGEGASKMTGLSSNITPIDSVDKTYLVSTSVMDLISSIDALDNIRLSGTDSKDWYIKEAKEKMKSGDIIYAGKYSAPDYELILTENCNFAIENTMIYHKPSVKDKLEELGVPVMVELSSYEKNPLGRLEWIKLYGVLYNKLDEAEDIFNNQVERVGKVESKTNSGLKVAVFSISSNGQVVVRRPGDYISTMVGMAGGIYVPANIEDTDTSAVSTTKITMEDFYLQAADADVLIYNSTIEGELSSISELVTKSEVLADFKAVKENKVYCIEKSYFQRTSDVAELIEDIHNILDKEDKSLTFIYQLED